MINGHHIPIPPSLQPYIKQVWLAEGDTETAYLSFADGTPGIVFQQAETGMTAGGKAFSIPTAYVFGQTINPVVITAPKGCRIIGLIFHPHVLKSVFRFDAEEITDTCIDVSLLPFKAKTDLTEQLWNSTDTHEQLGLLYNYIQSLIDKNDVAPDRGMAYAAGRIMQSGGGTSIRQLQTELNLSERTFERRFNQHVGLTPGLLSGIAQFQAALRQLRSGRFDKLSDIAYDNGYADQSHFIRAFRKFTGSTPLRFHRQLHDGDKNLVYNIS